MHHQSAAGREPKVAGCVSPSSRYSAVPASNSTMAKALSTLRMVLRSLRSTRPIREKPAAWRVAGPDLPAGGHVRVVGCQGATLQVELEA